MTAEEGSPTGGMSGMTSDVENIRKILFGDQVNQIEERFNQNETAIAQLRSENRNLRQALEAELTQRESSVQELQQRITALQNALDEKIQDARATGAQSLDAARQENAQRFAEIDTLIEEYLSAQEKFAAAITQFLRERRSHESGS